MSKRNKIDDIQDYVSQFGGKCLSTEYINISTPLKWRCEKGHTWDADLQIIKQGAWCPSCQKSHKNKEEKLEIIKKIAIDRGGKYISNEYINNRSKLLFKCKEAHEWLMTSHEIKAGQWCPKCGIKSRVEKAKTPIEVFIKHAENKGGKLLSENYINGHTNLLWQCNKGHQWKATGSMVIHKKSWCPNCQGRHKDISEMQNLAEKKGGKCLSKVYLNSTTKLEWQCDKGHIWFSEPYNIYDNCWCPTCGYEVSANKQKDDIEIYREIALENGGKLISNIYVNNRTPLIWECKEGHKWKALPRNVRHNKSWCPCCFDLSKNRKIRETNVK